jgi:hypothetical protein
VCSGRACSCQCSLIRRHPPMGKSCTHVVQFFVPRVGLRGGRVSAYDTQQFFPQRGGTTKPPLRIRVFDA